MNRRAKGNRFEIELCKCLDSIGFTTWRRRGTSRYGNVDILGLFDIIAVPKREREDDWTYLIQLKSNSSDFYRARKSIHRFAEEHFFGYDTALVTALRLKPKVYRFDIKLYRIKDSIDKVVDFTKSNDILLELDLL